MYAFAPSAHAQSDLNLAPGWTDGPVWHGSSFDVLVGAGSYGPVQSVQVVVLFDPAFLTFNSLTPLGAIPQSSVVVPFNFVSNGSAVTGVKWIGAFSGPEAQVAGNLFKMNFTWIGPNTGTTVQFSGDAFPTGLTPDEACSFTHAGVSTPPDRYLPGSGKICYANCDGSFWGPLNANDFQCFLNAFARGTGLPPSQQAMDYSNCDASTIPPVLNANDFLCFLNKFAAGCP
jgi:hypothetical protein